MITIPTAEQIVEAYQSGENVTFNVTTSDFMDSHAFFALPAQFDIVNKFFAKAAATPNLFQAGKQYTEQEIASIMGVSLETKSGVSGQHDFKSLYQPDYIDSSKASDGLKPAPFLQSRTGLPGF